MAAPPFTVKAVYEYTSEHDDDLKFDVGQIIKVTAEEGDDWYEGSYTDASGAKQEGLFPRNFVEKYEPAIPSRPTRAPRPKSEVRSPPPPAAEPDEEEPEEDVPPVPAASKPQPPPVDVLAASSKQAQDVVKSPQSATSQQSPAVKAEPPPAPKPAPAEPAQPAATPGKPPPPVAPKSNAFKDRIAAFNRAEAAPIAPMQPGRQGQRNEYIKKPFVAPPPSKNAYIPPVQKVEPVHKPYIREEDPEIKQKQDDDRAAAEAAGLTGDAPAPKSEEADEDAPKPMTLKERMALLQKEQEAQRARHADSAQLKERKAPAKKPIDPERAPVPEGEDEDVEGVRSPATERQSLDMPREKPRGTSAQRRVPTEPMSPVPSAPEHEILSGGEEADQSAAGETTEDDAGTIGPDEGDERSTSMPRAPAAPAREPDVGDEEDTAEEGQEEEEEEVDEEEQRKQRLRERMARLAGGQGGGPFNPFGAPPSAAPPTKKRSTREKKPAEEDTPSSPPHQMVAIPGMGGAPPVPMQRMHSPEAGVQRAATAPQHEMDEAEEDEPAPPPRRSTQEGRGAPPPVPKGKITRKPLLSKRKSFASFFRADSAQNVHSRSKSSPVNVIRDRMMNGGSELRAFAAEQTYFEHFTSSIITSQVSNTC